MSLTVRLPSTLRPTVGGRSAVSLEAEDLAGMERAIAQEYPELAARVLRDGVFGRFIVIFVDGEDSRFLGPNPDLRGAKTVELMPAISGGSVVPLPERRHGRNELFGSFIDETIGIVARQTRDTVSFAVGAPAREALDLVGAEALAAGVIRREGASALGYTMTEGEPELRQLVAAQARTRGLAVDAEEVLISAGALQAIDLACRLYLRPGDLVVAESPGFANALSAFRNRGARVLEVPVDHEGLDVGEAARLLRRSRARPRMFFVVPNFQNPTGATLSERRREALLALAASYRAVVVEDDPYGLLRYRGRDLTPLGALAVNTEVVSIGTFSKTFLPGLRVGWVIADRDAVRSMAAVKQTMDSSTGTLAQRIVLEFHRLGRAEDHLVALREIYRAKQERARAALAREFAGSGVSWNDPEGGFYFWVRLPSQVSARRLLEVALEEGVAFVPGDAFAIEADHRSALRFSVSAPTPERIDEGVRRLRRAFDRVCS
ncbi:MAG: aminotransferase class I/II-fold pyridoxal phosphate-dependent enzyme [Candidatus Limnocylindria bacterium]